MRARLPIKELYKVVQRAINTTGIKCLDGVPDNQEAPFYFMELLSIEPKNTKTMYVDSYTLYVHCIAPSELNKSSLGVFSLLDDLREALTNELFLESPYNILRLIDNGLIVNKTDETGERHAVESITIDVCYGFICKGE